MDHIEKHIWVVAVMIVITVAVGMGVAVHHTTTSLTRVANVLPTAGVKK